MNLALFVVALLAATPALAHPGHEVAGFAAGLVHPFSGWDHLAAMIAVGALAGVLGGSARWWLPGAFLAGMAMGMAAFALPMVEAGILASVVILGLALAAWVRPPLAVAIPQLLVFGLFHGHAHGAEMSTGSGADYALGVLIATGFLHAAGLLLIRETRRADLVLRLAGAAVAMIAGAGLLIG